MNDHEHAGPTTRPKSRSKAVVIAWSTTALVALVSCSGTFNYKPDLEQGFPIEPEKVQQLQVGMKPENVIAILGTPNLVNPFIANRWDYYYASRLKGALEVQQQSLRLLFEDGKLSDIGELRSSTELVSD